MRLFQELLNFLYGLLDVLAFRLTFR
jgi:hypothetical protein